MKYYSVDELYRTLADKISGLGLPKFKDNPAYELVVEGIKDSISRMCSEKEDGYQVQAREADGSISFKWNLKYGEEQTFTIAKEDKPDCFKVTRTAEHGSNSYSSDAEAETLTAAINESGELVVSKSSESISKSNGTLSAMFFNIEEKYDKDGIMYWQKEAKCDNSKNISNATVDEAKNWLSVYSKDDSFDRRSILQRDTLTTARYSEYSKGDLVYRSEVPLATSNLQKMVPAAGYAWTGNPKEETGVNIPAISQDQANNLMNNYSGKVKEGLGKLPLLEKPYISAFDKNYKNNLNPVLTNTDIYGGSHTY